MHLGLTVRERWYSLSRTQQLLIGGGAVAALLLVIFRKPVGTAVVKAGQSAAAAGRAAVTSAYNAVGDLASKAAWAKSLYAAVSQELPQLSVPARLLIVAHGGYESGWGTGKTVRRGNNNVFNITAGSAWKGAVDRAVNADTSYSAADCQRQGRPMDKTDSKGRRYCDIDQVWRKYGSVNEAVRDYWDFLGPNQNGGRYLLARQALEAADVTAFGNALSRAGYFTLPVGEYVANLQAIVNTARKFVGV